MIKEKTITRAEAFAAYLNAKSLLKSGSEMSVEKYDRFNAIMQKAGFQHVILPDVDTPEESLKIFKEATTKWCIIIALHKNTSVTWDCTEFSMFDCILRTNDYDGEEFYMWYPSPSEFKRLNGYISEQDEELLRKKAELSPQTCC
jgi:hypothetical protein